MNKEIALTKNEIQIINHSLGLDYKGKSFRNYFYTCECTEDYPLCESLVNKGLMKKTKERCKQFLVENGWKHDVDNDDDGYESYYKAMYSTVDIGKDGIVFVDNNGDFLHLPVNYYALIGALIEYNLIDMGYKSV